MFKQIICTGVLAAAVIANPANAQTFEETLELTYRSNPTLQAERAGVRAIEESVTQARSAWLPSVSAQASISSTRTEQSGGFFGNRTDSVTPQNYRIDASQAIWRGGEITGAINQAEANVLAAREGLRTTEQTVLLQAATAFLDVRRDGAIAQIRRNNVEVLLAQLDAAEDRFEVGEITRTDVSQAEARLASARAQLAAALSQLAASRARYDAVVGQYPATLTPEPPLPEMPQSVEDALEIALDYSPVLRAAAFNEDSAIANIRSARGAYSPDVSLNASASRTNDQNLSGDQTDRYSVTASVSVPLYTGGLNRSRVRQATFNADQARIRVIAARRQVEEVVTTAFNTLIASRSVIDSSQRSVEANEIALEGVQQEAFVGLRTTLDVLNAEQELLEARLTLVSAERDSYVAGLTLLQAMGLLTAETLEISGDPEPYLSEPTRANFDLTPWN
ncbi:TolC family outer membrane protein [Hyphobacterium sp. HN65]|uniref:TolC family outer membrane protein n=1 Tax=Hyphobacterium lacteum TaxID=3116575 RepID=A0ABU7LT87_9PROT|nr:TolC family outer membrane protein [Hyphobacterium sp. HN65]MEE2527123.1 TolC family outer membrane protein [Hyphobacterium sp. HN65]